jgi:hypothetical protein
MFTVIFRFRNEPSKEVIASMESLFYICTILENSTDILNFKVSMQGTTVFPNHFGWGKFSKWVEKLYKIEEG